MKQIYPRTFNGLGYSAFTQTGDVIDGQQSLTVGVGPAPMIFPGVARNLTIYNGDILDIDVIVTVMVSGAASLQAASLAAGVVGRQAADLTNTTSYVAGDYLFYRFQNSNIEPPVGLSFGCCLECEQAAQTYGICAGGGTIPVGPAFVGGALGNGNFSAWSGSPTDMGSTYSIAAINGVIDHLALLRFTGQAGGGWFAWLIVDGVLQDGSGGTVDTLIDLADTDPAYKVRTFSVPLVAGHYYAVAQSRYGTTALFGGQVSASVAVTPTTPGEFMLTGGNNDTIPIADPFAWKWVTSQQNAVQQTQHTAPLGQTPVTLRGLYEERGGRTGINGAPGIGASFINTILKSGLPTAITCTQSNSATSCSISGQNVVTVAGDLITYQVENINSPAPANTQLHWGVAASLTTPMGQLIVVKDVPDSDPDTEFPMLIGGGLTPASISLMDGESQTYDGVTPGSGYSVLERVPRGWAVSYDVSNGSPVNNISIDAGEIVTVTVTNVAACPGEPAAPRTDGVPYAPPDVAPCSGDGEVTSPRTGA